MPALPTPAIVRCLPWLLLLSLMPVTALANSTERGRMAPQDVDGLVGVQWFGVYLFGAKAGAARSALQAEGAHFVVKESVDVRVRAFGSDQAIRLESERRYARRDGALVSVSSSFEQRGQVVRGTLRVQGDRATLVQTIAGKEERRRLPAPRETLDDALALHRLLRDGARKGDRLVARTFEPLPPFSRELELSHEVKDSVERVVDGVAMQLVVVRSTAPAQGMDVKTILRPDGRVVETEMMGMMRLRAEPEAVAKSGGATPDVLALSLARPDKPLVRTEDLDELVLRLKLPEEPPTFSGPHVQVLERHPAYVEVRLQRGGDVGGQPGDAEAGRDARSATSLIQSDDDRIIARARQVTKGAKGPAAKVERLVRHVHETVRKDYRAALSNALDVLLDPVGDCTEHSVYFVALARALGIPARLVVGLAYTPEAGGGFGGHAWADVLLDGRWVQVDPTFGEVRANAAHIPFGVGNLEDIGHLASLIGRVRIVVRATRHSGAPDDIPDPEKARGAPAPSTKKETP